jgi:hypothetical protein
MKYVSVEWTESAQAKYQWRILINSVVHDCPLYLECPDVLSPVEELLSGDGWG